MSVVQTDPTDEQPDDLVLVRWRGGIWKIVDCCLITYKIRWVCGPRPDEGIFHNVRFRETTMLTDMEVIAIAVREDVVL